MNMVLGRKMSGQTKKMQSERYSRHSKNFTPQDSNVDLENYKLKSRQEQAGRIIKANKMRDFFSNRSLEQKNSELTENQNTDSIAGQSNPHSPKKQRVKTFSIQKLQDCSAFENFHQSATWKGKNSWSVKSIKKFKINPKVGPIYYFQLFQLLKLKNFLKMQTHLM